MFTRVVAGPRGPCHFAGIVEGVGTALPAAERSEVADLAAAPQHRVRAAVGRLRLPGDLIGTADSIRPAWAAAERSQGAHGAVPKERPMDTLRAMGPADDVARGVEAVGPTGRPAQRAQIG